MSNITFAPFPIPVVTPKGNGYVVYFKCNSMWENDEVLVAMDDGGQYFHFNTGQLQAWKNPTYGINTPKIKVDVDTTLIEKKLSSLGCWTDEDMMEFSKFYMASSNSESDEDTFERFKNNRHEERHR